jgi:lipid II:glycine glycyltransferase (peptidoglycan interpeptide bridge formation enzyme)
MPFFHLTSPLIGNLVICLPSTDTCFPLANTENDYRQLLKETINELSKNGNASIQINGCSKFGMTDDMGFGRGYNSRLVQVVDINRDLDAIRAGMTRNGRYNLRAAQKQPITIKLGQDEKDLKLLYKMTVDTLQRTSAFPPAYSFFRSIFFHLITKGYGSMFLAEYQGKIIAGILCLYYKDTVLCKYSGQNEKYLEYRPNYSLHWKAIEHFHNKSFKYYDFGGTDSDDQGLLFFKRNWGIKETSRSFYYYPQEIACKSVQVAKHFNSPYKAALKSMPRPAIELLSTCLNRHYY